MQPDLDRIAGQAKFRRHVFGRHFFDIPQHQHRPVRVGQRGNRLTNQPEPLLALEQLIGRRRPRGKGFRVMAVFEKGGQERVYRFLGLPPPGPQAHQGPVDDDAVQPGAELRAAVEGRQGLERRKVGRLHDVPGVLLVLDNAPGDGQQPSPVGPDQELVRGVIPGAEPVEQGRVVGGVHMRGLGRRI